MSFIVELLSTVLGDFKLHNESSCQVSFDCPACSDEKGLVDGDGKGNLEINYSKNVFKCWSCSDRNDMKGPIDKLIKRYGNKSLLKDFKLLTSDLHDYEQEDDLNDLKIEIIKLPSEFIPLKNSDSKNLVLSKAFKYLFKRGITKDIIERYNIGVCLKGKYANRIVIPSYDKYGKLNYFVTRDYTGKNKMKYLNPKVDKSSIIFNERLINYESDVYLVEGTFDHIVVPNSIPLLGLVLNDNLFNTLQLKCKSNVILFLDGEALEESYLLYDKLNTLYLKDRVRIIKVKEGMDASSINEEYGKKTLLSVLGSFKQLSENFIK